MHLGLYLAVPDKQAGKLVQGVLDTVGRPVVRPCTFAGLAERIADTGTQDGWLHSC